jgi:AraC-like DNA-binding protein
VIELSNILAKRPTKGNKKLVDKAIRYIKTHYYKEIELAEIAHFTEVSDSYLIRTFKKVTGKTLNQYITSYRIQQAKYFLKDKSVKETANAVGFKNSSYFSNVFKKTTGLSPLQFQKINMKKNNNQAIKKEPF